MKCSNCGTGLHHGHGSCVACGQPLSPLSRRYVEAEGRLAQLLARRQKGELDQTGFQAARKQIIVQDLDGGRWTPSTRIGEWHWYDGQRWVLRDPRDALAVERVRMSGVRQAPAWYKRRWVWAAAAIAGVIILAGICGGAFLLMRSFDLIDLGQRAETPVATSQETPATGDVTAQVVQLGEATVVDIDTQGGEVVGPDRARVIIPGEVLAAPAPVSIAPVVAAPPFPAEYGVAPAGPAFEVTLPQGTQLPRRPPPLPSPLHPAHLVGHPIPADSSTCHWAATVFESSGQIKQTRMRMATSTTTTTSWTIRQISPWC